MFGVYDNCTVYEIGRETYSDAVRFCDEHTWYNDLMHWWVSEVFTDAAQMIVEWRLPGLLESFLIVIMAVAPYVLMLAAAVAAADYSIGAIWRRLRRS